MSVTVMPVYPAAALGAAWFAAEYLKGLSFVKKAAKKSKKAQARDGTSFC